jgi:Mg2+-importing ATPase
MGDDVADLREYWSQRTDKLLDALETSPEGLSAADASSRLSEHGPNALEDRERATGLRIFLNQFKNPIVLILLFATGVSAIVKDWVDALIILAIVLGSAVLSFMQEHGASKAAEKLRAQVKVRSVTLRDGQPQSIPADEVVPGDVVLLSAGSLIPADGVLLEARDFYVSEAVLTGEAFPVEKTPGEAPSDASLPERTNCVFMGTNVRSGSARAVIVETGARTAFGQIAKRLTLRAPETEFERGVRQFGYLLSEVMLLLVLVIFAVNVYCHEPILDSLLFSVALAVGLTPQLLPAIVSINLSKGAQAMAKEGVIVRRLVSLENFGSMDVLCTDKTGTLTEGVVRLDGALDPQGVASEGVFRCAYLNAHFQTGLASPLDEAIVSQGEPDIGVVSKLDEMPYDFVRKRLSVVVEDDKGPLLITKGALDNVLAVCVEVDNGEASVPLTGPVRSGIEQRFVEWSGQGFRVLGVATKRVGRQPGYHRRDEQGMTFIGYLLFLDPPKAGTKEAIADLAGLGVQLKIISGDNKLVAQHTAQAMGLEVTGMLTGRELNDLRDEALWHAVGRANLFAEVDPNQKERVILALQKTGHVVGYMGDGINDAPALHAADVGISVEKAVDVAKEAADFVLVERNLSVLHQGIVLGRTTFANTLKYVFITTSANFGNMFSMAGASLFLPFLPMLPMQILLMNFLTDLPAMTIAGDSVDREWVDEPRRWNVGFIRQFMVTFGAVSSLFDFATFAALLFVVRASVDQFRTGWFLESVVTELLILLVVRTQRAIFESRPGKPLLVVSLLVAMCTVVLPYSLLSGVLGFVALPPSTLALLGLISVSYVAGSELVKRVFYQHVRA